MVGTESDTDKICQDGVTPRVGVDYACLGGIEKVVRWMYQLIKG